MRGRSRELDGSWPPSSSGATSSGGGSDPATVELLFLQGVRAVASIGVVLLHCFMFWQFFLPYPVKYQLTNYNPLIRLASAGMVWVDVLFIISAMLAAYQLIPRMEGQFPAAPSCRQVVLSYWRNRAWRILPAYLVGNLLAAFALGPVEVPAEAQAARWMHFYHCPRTIWANFLLIQNWLGNQACAIHFWTVALQCQFYTSFPLLMWALKPRAAGFRRRLAASLAVIALAGTAWRVWAAWHSGLLELPVADFAVDQTSQLSWANMLHAIYLPTASRITGLAAGAALGLLLRSPAAVQAVHRRRKLLAAAAICLQAAYAHLLHSWHVLFREPSTAPWPLTTTRLHISLLSFGSPFITALVCCSLLALLFRSDPLHSLGAELFSSDRWRPLADLSYCQYLLHEQAKLWVIMYILPPGFLPPFIFEYPLLSFACVSLGTLLVGYAAALPLHRLLERRLSPRSLAQTYAD